MNNLPEIVVELGINSNGSLETAEQMIAESWRALYLNGGYPANKIFWKMQKRTPELAVPRHMRDTPRKNLVTGEMGTYLEYKEAIEHPVDDYLSLADHIWFLSNGLGGRLFASVWDEGSVEDIEKFNKETRSDVPYIKIPSAHLTSLELIRAAVNTGIPLILSTGMSTQQELGHAVACIPGGYDLTIMACTATYPMPDNEANLLKIRTLQSRYGNTAKIGFSSHSPSPMPPIYSNFFDVDMIEVHFTLDRAMEGSDHAASLEAKALELLARETLRIPQLYGHGEIKPYASEMSKRKALRG